MGRARRTRRGPSPGLLRRMPAGRTGRWRSTSGTSRTGRSSRSTTSVWRSRRAVGRRTTTTTAATSTRTTSGAASRGPPWRRRRSASVSTPDANASSSEPGRLSIETIRSDEGWGWVYMVLHGHRLDHLTVIEPWVEVLRRRQADGDPFVEDPRPPDFETFWAADRSDPGRAPRPARAGAAGGLDEHRADAGLDAARPRRAPRRLGRGGRSRRRRVPANRIVAGGPGGGDRRLERATCRCVGVGDPRRGPRPLRPGVRPDARGGRVAGARRSCARPTAGRGSTTACTGTFASTSP